VKSRSPSELSRLASQILWPLFLAPFLGCAIRASIDDDVVTVKLIGAVTGLPLKIEAYDRADLIFTRSVRCASTDGKLALDPRVRALGRGGMITVEQLVDGEVRGGIATADHLRRNATSITLRPERQMTVLLSEEDDFDDTTDVVMALHWYDFESQSWIDVTTTSRWLKDRNNRIDCFSYAPRGRKRVLVYGMSEALPTMSEFSDEREVQIELERGSRLLAHLCGRTGESVPEQYQYEHDFPCHLYGVLRPRDPTAWQPFLITRFRRGDPSYDSWESRGHCSWLDDGTAELEWPSLFAGDYDLTIYRWPTDIALAFARVRIEPQRDAYTDVMLENLASGSIAVFDKTTGTRIEQGAIVIVGPAGQHPRHTIWLDSDPQVTVGAEGIAAVVAARGYRIQETHIRLGSNVAELAPGIEVSVQLEFEGLDPADFEFFLEGQFEDTAFLFERAGYMDYLDAYRIPIQAEEITVKVGRPGTYALRLYDRVGEALVRAEPASVEVPERGCACRFEIHR